MNLSYQTMLFSIFCGHFSTFLDVSFVMVKRLPPYNICIYVNIRLNNFCHTHPPQYQMGWASIQLLAHESLKTVGCQICHILRFTYLICCSCAMMVFSNRTTSSNMLDDLL